MKMERLTNLEELMMKCIWEYGDKMPFLQMSSELKEKFHKDYKRTSIRTYLFRLEEKGYIKVETIKNRAYIHMLIDEESYKQQKATEMLDSWFHGSVKELMSALSDNVEEEEKKQLTDMLEEMEFE